MSMILDPQGTLEIVPERTPNPHSVKYRVSRLLLDGAGYDFDAPEKALHAPLAAELFALPGVAGVFLGPDFVTVTTAEGAGDPQRVLQVLREYLGSGRPVVTEAIQGQALPLKFTSEIELGIVNILEQEIRPAVAMDGGDIVFAGYEDGVVRLQLRGSCSGCPSSLLTLKMGIETRLRQVYPQIQRVEAV